ncbi:cytosine permease [Pseudonocardia eucalypti]|uniref:Cytosine permease n=1 Tax=Pseudonocardia eucalypti TaxID=648755 RepID=A0ABP9QSG2_9PSEU|nr:NCS1 nucleoside transporter family [Pseudonocardia eucalypti]
MAEAAEVGGPPGARVTVDARGAVSGEPVRPGSYGDRVVAVEPGGVEFIPAGDRHGRPLHLAWTWTSPNLEFATIFLGVLAVGVFRLPFWEAVAALVLGNALGALSHGLLSARGPRHGVPQMVLSRVGFGYWGNVLPAGLNAVAAGIGWFAVNSVSGAFALSALTGLPALAALVIVVLVQVLVAFFGHNLVQAFERYAVIFLAVVFLAVTVVVLGKAQPGAPADPVPGGFLLVVAATFGYTAGWNPYAADYTRYLPADTDPRRTGWSAGLGIFASCTVLEIVGAASVTAGALSSENPVGAFTALLPGWLAALTLSAIMLGAVSANVLNIYSGAISFLTLGIRTSLAFRRALVAIGFGAVGFLLAWAGLTGASHKYESFLLVIAYWIAPWLGVTFADIWLRRGQPVAHLFYDTGHRNWAGPVAMLVGIAVSVPLFSNQTAFTGVVAAHFPGLGDVVCLVGFGVAAAVYAALFRLARAGSAGARDGSGGAGDGSAGAGDGSAGAGDGSAGAGDGSAGAGDGFGGAGDGSAGAGDGSAGARDGSPIAD